MVKIIILVIVFFLLFKLRYFFVKLVRFIGWKIKDTRDTIKNGRQFTEYGLTLYAGKQGTGKSTSLVEYLERMRVRYPKAYIITNFDYKYQTQPMTTWRDLLTVRNGVDGVIFAIDEIQNEYNSNDWKDFPEDLLSEITQQRKQRIKIVASSQIFKRVVVQLREQAHDVVVCRTLFGRWVFQKCIDADDYADTIDTVDKKNKVHRKWRRNFIMTDELRNLFDSYKKIERMRKQKFIDRTKR